MELTDERTVEKFLYTETATSKEMGPGFYTTYGAFDRPKVEKPTCRTKKAKTISETLAAEADDDFPIPFNVTSQRYDIKEQITGF